MSSKGVGKKHINYETRKMIEECLKAGWSLRDVAAYVGYSYWTVYKEIGNNKDMYSADRRQKEVQEIKRRQYEKIGERISKANKLRYQNRLTPKQNRKQERIRQLEEMIESSKVVQYELSLMPKQEVVAEVRQEKEEKEVRASTGEMELRIEALEMQVEFLINEIKTIRRDYEGSIDQ